LTELKTAAWWRFALSLSYDDDDDAYHSQTDSDRPARGPYDYSSGETEK